MPRNTGSVPYPTAPTVAPAGPVAGAVPQVRSTDTGDSLGSVFSNFFGSLGNAAQAVSDAEELQTKTEIVHQNEINQNVARAKAIRGEELTPEEAANWNFSTPYKQTKATLAANEDAQAFVDGTVKNMDLVSVANAKAAMGATIQDKLKGIQDKEFASYYAETFLKVAQPAIDQHKANLVQAQKLQDRDQAIAAANADMKLGKLNTPEAIDAVIARTVGIMGPENARTTRQYVVGKLLTNAALNGKLDDVVSALSQPQKPSKDNPEGLSWAGQFPDAFEQYVQEARKQHSDRYNLAVGDALHDIELAMNAGDSEVEPGVTGVQKAALLMASYRQNYDVRDSRYRALEDKFVTLWKKSADKNRAVLRLVGAEQTGLAPKPEDVNKYGGDLLNTVIQTKGVDRAISMVRAWNQLPKDWAAQVQANITNTDRPNVAAEYLNKVVLPLYRQAPALVSKEFGADADFVARYVDEEQKAGNADTLAAVTDAFKSLDYIRANQIDPKNVVMWDRSDQNGRQKFEDNLRSKIADAVKGGVQGGFLDRLFSSGHVVVGDEVERMAYERAQHEYLLFAQAGRKDAADLATKAAIDGIAKRTVALPNAEGNYVIVPDTSPDAREGHPVMKWQRITDPAGKVVYDPNEAFQKDSQLEKLHFIAGGGQLGLMPGQDTQVDGAYTVTDPMGHPIRFASGQKLEWSEHEDGRGYPTPEGGMVFPDARDVHHEVTLLANPKGAAEQLSDLFKGTGFRASAVRAPGGQNVWELQYIPSPNDQARALRDPAVAARLSQEQAVERQMEIDSKANEMGPPAPTPMQTITSKLLYGQELDKKVRDKIYAPWTDPINIDGQFFKDSLSKLVSVFRDKGMLPQSIGTTKPIPTDFKTSQEAWDWVMSQMDGMKQKLGGLPVEPNDTPIEKRYVTARRQFLETNEGRRSVVYKDIEGHATVGIGFNLDAPATTDIMKRHGLDVAGIRAGKVAMTDDQINSVFEDVILNAEKVVSSRIHVPLTAQQRIALVSLAYNDPDLIGPKLSAAINSGDKKAALNEILTNSGTQHDPRLRFRRGREADLLASGSFVSPALASTK